MLEKTKKDVVMHVTEIIMSRYQDKGIKHANPIVRIDGNTKILMILIDSEKPNMGSDFYEFFEETVKKIEQFVTAVGFKPEEKKYKYGFGMAYFSFND